MAVEAFFGAKTVWHSDIKPAAVKLIDHYWPGTNLGDITAIDWSQVEPVDIISGGSPCQDMSAAGKRAGMKAGTRSGLWSNMRHAIETIRPAHVVWENVRGAYSAAADSDMEPCPWCVGDGPDVSLRACGRVLGDLADLGYDAQWCGLRAADVGAPHGRFRVFILASNSDGLAGSAGGSLEGRPGALDEPRKVTRALGSDRPHSSPDSGRGEQREQAERGLRAEPWDCSQGVTANSERLGSERRGGHGNVARPSGTSEADSGQRERHGDATDDRSPVDWGQYEPAIRRWGAILGRPAPRPTITGPKGGQQLSPDLTDWMMGWPEGWTDIPGIKRAERLSMGGDGVVPQQAFEALRLLSAVALERAA